MMPVELEALARRAMSCKHWRWMPGMLTTQNFRLVEIDPTLIVCDGRSMMHFRTRICLTWPELTDSATLGCLLAVVREAWNDPTASVWFDDTKYGDGQMWMWRAGDKGRCMYDTEAEALVAALEGAP